MLCVGLLGCGGANSAGSSLHGAGQFGGSTGGPSSTGVAAANGGPGSTGAGAASGGGLIPAPGSSDPTPGGEKTCASAVVQTAKNMPTIVFVIDGSGSMCAPFGGSTRWQAVRTALLDPMKGLIYRLQNSVSFGATLYDGTIDFALALSGQTGGGMGSSAQNPQCALQSAMGKNMGMCPQLLEAMPAKLNNAMAIDMLYPKKELGGSTPTDKAMNHVMDALIAGRQQQAPDQKAQSPVYVILATDGAPNDICVSGAGGDGSAQRQGVIAAVDRGTAAGITTWVISLAGGDAMLQAHLDEVAKHGDPKNTAAHTFSPMNPDELIMTLAQLLGGAVGCHIALNGKVMVGQECSGTVEQNGMALPCCQQTAPGSFGCARTPTTTPNGWRLTDEHSIELLGDACTKFLVGSGALLSARFPCAVFVPD
jgi:hypothetical protein